MNHSTQSITSAGAALRIVLVYAVFASLWILLSDKAVGWLFADPDTMTRASMAKGWLFVAVTALLLFSLIQRLAAGLQQAIETVSQSERALQQSENQLQATLDALPDLLFEVGLDGRIYRYHSHRSDLLAAPPEVFLGKSFSDVLPPDVSATCAVAVAEAAENGFSNGKTYALQLPQGERWFDLSVAPMRAVVGQQRRFIMIARDITANKAHQDQLEHIAHFDALTNLPNRLLLSDRLHLAMIQAQRRGQQLAVAYLDLDSFKHINDQHGHDVGDELLIALSQCMKDTLREGDTLARMGGDEFVAVFVDLDHENASLPMLDRLLQAAAEQVIRGGKKLRVSASLGVTFYPQSQDMDADQLLRQADQAMYQAKLAGKNRYHLFDAVQDSNIRGHHESLDHIRHALEHGELVLYYQPKVNMRSGRVIGAEALIRWQHPQRGLLAPGAFLPVVEDDPLAVLIGEWVIDTALRQVELWRTAGLDIPVSVNVGARQLQQGDFVVRLQAILAAHPWLPPSCLELEILETSALKDMAQVSQVIDECARFGVNFALDDFGTGYSSLTYLKRLRVTLLKIDQSFVRDMLDDPDDLAILEGVIGLASAFKRQVIAEGVETVGHGTRLLQLGCEQVQGYGVARPMPGAAMPDWVAAWRPAPEWLEGK
jgi:diguanylate cyclase (GGDEF)-like protein/PAS domain S-box-containing protein